MKKNVEYASATKEIIEDAEFKEKTLKTKERLNQHDRKKLVDDALKNLAYFYAETNVDFRIIAEQGLDYNEVFMKAYRKGILYYYNKQSIEKALDTAVKETKILNKKEVIILR